MWETPISDFEKINKDLMKLYFDQTEKCLKSSLDLSDRITNRSYAILTFLVPVISILISYLSKHYLLEETSSPITVINLLSIIIVPMLICLGLVLYVLFPKHYYYLGSSPKNKIQERVFNNSDYPDEASYKLMLNYEIEEYQLRIDYTDDQNNSRISILKKAFIILISTIAIFLTYLILAILQTKICL